MCVGSLVKLCLGVEANVEVLLYFSAEGAGRLYILHIFSSLCLPPACHVLDKDFSQFSGSLQLFPPGKPRPSSFSVPVGGDFSVPPTPFDTLLLPFFFLPFSFFFFFFCQSLSPAFVSTFPLMSCQSQSFHFASLFYSSLCSLLKHFSFSQDHFCFFSLAYSIFPIQHPFFQVLSSLKGTLN